MTEAINVEASPRRIALLEDDPAVSAHFHDIVASAADLEMCGAAASLAEASGLLNLGPDLLLSDLGLPDGNGLDFIPRMKAACDCRILVITAFGDRDTVVRALNAGADGYLLKDSSSEAVLDGIRATLDGGAPISPSAAVYLLERLRAADPPLETPSPAADLATARLTPREVELLELFSRGQSYKIAARTLGISPMTVGNHVKSIYRKLEVNSRAEAVYQAGLLTPRGR